MEYRTFGRTGVKVSPLCMGCMTFGSKTDSQEACRLVDRCIEAGINFFDTANVYTRGKSESMLGDALRRNGKRDSIILATKFHAGMDDNDPNMRGNSRRHLIQQCEASLRRLQTDWIDIYQVHRPQSEIPVDETLRAMDDLVRQGKVRYIGTSTFAAWQVVESLWVSHSLGLNRMVSEQPPYHLLDRRIERELVPVALTYGIGLIPWSPLAGGFLTGKYSREGASPENSRLTRENDWTAKHFTDAAFDALEALEKLARQKGCSVSQFALAWCMHQPAMTSPIIGPRSMDQLEDNLKALDVQINDDDRKAVDQVSPPGGVIVSYYDADFGPHKHRIV